MELAQGSTLFIKVDDSEIVYGLGRVFWNNTDLWLIGAGDPTYAINADNDFEIEEGIETFFRLYTNYGILPTTVYVDVNIIVVESTN